MLAYQGDSFPLVGSVVLQLDGSKHFPGSEILGKVYPFTVA